MFMKDFLKWLGVNEKVAKVAIWLFIIMAFLIITNTLLDSIGLPYYKITVDNLVKINTNKVMDFFASMLISFLDFITMIFLVFRIKNIKKILPYSLLYLLINYLIDLSGNYILMQAFIIIYFLIFCYFYSGRKPKYILYGIISYVLSVFVQFVWFSYKASSIDINSIDETTKMILTFDYFIIMGMIILAKEIYLKKRRDKKCEVHLDATTGSENSKKKATLPKN